MVSMIREAMLIIYISMEWNGTALYVMMCLLYAIQSYAIFVKMVWYCMLCYGMLCYEIWENDHPFTEEFYIFKLWFTGWILLKQTIFIVCNKVTIVLFLITS